MLTRAQRSKWRADVSVARRGPFRRRSFRDHRLLYRRMNSRRHCRRSLPGRPLARPAQEV